MVDHAIGDGAEGVVGTYRLIQREAAARLGRFYSADEYDITPIDELSRPHAGTRALLRRCRLSQPGGDATAVARHRRLRVPLPDRPDVRLRQPATAPIPDALAADLTYLYHNHLAPPAVRPRALPHRYVEMRRMLPGQLDPKRVQAQLPPLIKGYLRLGGFVGDGAVIDRQFNTTDVAVVVKTDLVTDKYYRHYERQLRDALD